MNNRSSQHGQGLLEAIIAIGIILTATIASLTLIVSSIEASRGVRERLIASNLAREGIEAVRAARDSNWLADRDWTTGWAVPNTTVKEIATFAPSQIFLPDNPSVTRWSFTQGIVDISSTDAKLYITATSPGRYVQQSGGASGQDSGFRRLITVTPESTSAYLVSSQVVYTVRGKSKTLTLQERMTNWKP